MLGWLYMVLDVVGLERRWHVQGDFKVENPDRLMNAVYIPSVCILCDYNSISSCTCVQIKVYKPAVSIRQNVLESYISRHHTVCKQINSNSFTNEITLLFAFKSHM